MDEMDDMTLLREYAARHSETAFETLVSRRVGFVYSAALRQVRDPYLAEEVTHAVFIILARKAPRISDKTILTGWLFKTTHFTALAQTRAAAKRREREQEAHLQTEIEQAAPDPLWEQMSPMLDGALASLSEADRQAILLRFFENKDLAEVGNALRTSEDTARKRVARALEKLRKYFSRRGVVSTSAIIAGEISANSAQAAPIALAKSATAVAIKSAAVSSSTLTLIKEALKLMAWSKAKTLIVIAIAAAVATGTTTIVVKKVVSSRTDAIFEQLWARPDASTTQALTQAPPALIVRPTHYATHLSQGYWTDARIGHGVWVNATIQELVQFGYEVVPSRILWLADVPSGGFDLMETLPAAQNNLMLQKEIQKQFGLAGHMEMRDSDLFRLQIADPAPLRSYISKGGQPTEYGVVGTNNSMSYIFKNKTLQDVATRFEAYFDRPVIEPNNLAGRYDFTFQVAYDLHGETLRQSIRSQLADLGLELVPAREPVKMLVVEKAK
ncbi:MAG TPA: TIGR03435 family protein [Verrucomicrobiae bacterium]|jgi:uncharacterized protein (TIGR03435 family)|nr:TIGR03435 family protein [Verrucomicrobiae bacterium]